MRSLTVKLTLAFLLIGMIGAVLVALLVGQRTRSEFDRYLSAHDQEILSDALATYYATHGEWQGVAQMIANTPPLVFYSQSIALADAQGRIVLSKGTYRANQYVPPTLLKTSNAIQVDGQTVGFILFAFSDDHGPNPRGHPPDAAFSFLQRIGWATAISALIAALIALILGILLARTLTHPIRELTAATQAMARGNLNQHVSVRSRDEIGELAASFNQMSADLTHASYLRTQMTADLAHDLRTPLSILRGYTEGLKDGRLQGTTTTFAIMHDEVEHLQRLVEDLRILSLADAGALSLQRRLIDPAALLERTGLAYIVSAEHQGLTLRVDADAQLPSIYVDTDRMTQVLNNLVSNALQHTKQGEIVLAAIADQRHVLLTIRDSGIGIDPADQPFIFDRFYRVDKARQRNDHTTSGLGLAIAKAIVEAHGGTISVNSALEHGTTFTITLSAA